MSVDPVMPVALQPLVIQMISLPMVNAALQQMDVPAISAITIINPNDQEVGPLRIRVELDPAVAPVWETTVQFLRPQEPLILDERHVKLPLSAERLANQLEAERGSIRLTIESPDGVIEFRAPLVLQPYNQWLGLDVHPESIASFVQPNHPALAPFLHAAQMALRESTQDASLQGYQAGPERAERITRAIWAAGQSFGIAYIDPPSSWGSGQKILLPDQVLGDRMGTCLDLTVFLAAALERAGLNPIIVAIEGHAFPGVFLKDTDSLSATMIVDGTELSKHVEAGRVLVFDSSSMAQGKAFTDACGIAQVQHLNPSTFQFAVDIAQARRQGILPLPIRTSAYALAAPDPASLKLPSVPEVILTGVAPRTIPDRPFSKSGPQTIAERRIARWKGRLLDLSLRNPLLNFKLDGRRSLPLLADNVAALEDAISSREFFALQPADAGGLRSQILFEQRTGKDMLREQARELLKKRILLPDLPGADAAKRIVDMYRMARTLSEETGQTGAWLALGFLEWYETSAAKEPRRAPLVLIPVEIVRGSIREPFRIRVADDEPRINSTLLKKLETDFRLDIADYDELPEDEAGLDVPLIFNRFRTLVEPVPRCRIVELAAVGFFSFTKHMMWLDLEARTDALLKNTVVRHLLESDGRPFGLARPFVAAADLDQHRQPKDDLAVVEADSSQLVAVQGAIDGNTFVLEGPPGTGKSQTITNLIAELIGTGQSVLFVAEKPAAIEVVKDRLAKVGLGPFCLDLHAYDATKLEIIQALAEPLDLPRTPAAAELPKNAADLAKLRNELTITWRVLHATGAAGVSVWQAITRLGDLGSEPVVRFDFDASGPLDDRRWDLLRESARELGWAAKPVGRPAAHVFASSRLSDWTPKREAQIARALETQQLAATRLTSALAELSSLGISLLTCDRVRLRNLAHFLEVERSMPAGASAIYAIAPNPDVRRGLNEVVVLAQKRNALLAELGRVWRVDALLDLDTKGLGTRFERFASAFFLIAFFALMSARKIVARVASTSLPKNKEIARDLGKAEQARIHTAALAARPDDVARVFSGSLEDTAGVEGAIAALPARLAWCDLRRGAAQSLAANLADGVCLDQPVPLAESVVSSFRDALANYDRATDDVVAALDVAPGVLDGNATIAEIGKHVTRWQPELKRLRDWAGYARARKAAIDSGIGPFVDAFEGGRIDASAIEAALERSAMMWRIEDAMSSEPALARFRGADHETRAAAFAKLDDERQRLAREEVRHRIMKRLPDPSMDVGEVGLLRTELKKKRKHLPLRKLFAKIPTILPRLKPCVLMSPMSVAQYLDPSLSLFDVVVFDEASQIPPWDAIGALGRGRRAIIVGDSKQMPPTSFFGKADGDEGDDDIEEMESILDECDRSGIPKLSLKWHYRSRHPSLIQFSNARYYDSQLITFPAAAAHVPSLGVRWMPVDGVYDKGGTRANLIEAQAVTKEVVRRLMDPMFAKKTIGVVTFAMPQRDLIFEMLDAERTKNPALDRHFDPKQSPEPVFIKNLENVQGDERDVIIFSMSYGPDKHGKVALNFGALNRSGGERRLNVAVTRAREQLLVVSSLRPEHISEGRTSAIGVRHLREFLAFAQKNGQTTSAEEALMREADSAGCIAEIEARLRGLGYRTDRNIGAPGPRVDIAVRDPDAPEEYLLGIVTDSPVWARFPSIRDREKLGPSVLERQGWRLHRLWSLDWWHDSKGQLELIVEKTMLAREAARLDRELGQLETDDEPMDVSAVASPLVQANAPAETPRNLVAQESPLYASTTSPPASPADAVGRARTSSMTWLGVETGVWKAQAYQRLPLVVLGDETNAGDVRYHRWVAERLVEVVAAEGPIYKDDAVRRAFDSWNIPKVGRNMRDAVIAELIRAAPPERRPRLVGDVFWPPELDPKSWVAFRVSRPDDPDIRAADSVPLVELRNATLAVLARTLSLAEDQLIGQLMQIFGIARRGSKVVEHFRQGVDLAVDSGRAARDGDTLRFVELAS